LYVVVPVLVTVAENFTTYSDVVAVLIVAICHLEFWATMFGQLGPILSNFWTLFCTQVKELISEIKGEKKKDSQNKVEGDSENTKTSEEVGKTEDGDIQLENPESVIEESAGIVGNIRDMDDVEMFFVCVDAILIYVFLFF